MLNVPPAAATPITDSTELTHTKRHETHQQHAWIYSYRRTDRWEMKGGPWVMKHDGCLRTGTEAQWAAGWGLMSHVLWPSQSPHLKWTFRGSISLWSCFVLGGVVMLKQVKHKLWTQSWRNIIVWNIIGWWRVDLAALEIRGLTRTSREVEYSQVALAEWLDADRCSHTVSEPDLDSVTWLWHTHTHNI